MQWEEWGNTTREPHPVLYPTIEALSEEVIVTVIATGFEDESEPLYQSYNNDTSLSMDDSDIDDLPPFLRDRDI